MWCVSGNHGSWWKSKLFNRAKNVKKVKPSFFGTPSSQAISQILYELRTPSLAYSIHYNQYLIILHYPWLRMKSKLFSRAKYVKKWKSSFSGTPSSTSDFSDLIWTRDFRVGSFNSLSSILNNFALKSKLTDFTLSHGSQKRIKTHHKYWVKFSLKIAWYSLKNHVKFSIKFRKISWKSREIFLKIEWNFLKNWEKFSLKLIEVFLTIWWNSFKNWYKLKFF